MNIWDEKAKNYARYSDALTPVMEDFFEFIKSSGLDFENKRVLDVGGGTGVWSLHLAKLAKEVLVIDASAKMLEYLEEDRIRLGLKNIKSLQVGFNDFKKDKDFDIVFLSMCPVLNLPVDFEHFLNLAKRRVYINFASLRVSDFLNPIFEHFNSVPKDFGKDDLEWYLDKLGLPYVKKVYKEKRVIKRSFEQALETAKWHLKINEASFDENELACMIPKGGVSESISSDIKCLVL